MPYSTCHNYVLFVENILSSIWQFWKEQLDIKLSCICIDLNTQLINVQWVNFVLQIIAVIKEQLIKITISKGTIAYESTTKWTERKFETFNFSYGIFRICENQYYLYGLTV